MKYQTTLLSLFLGFCTACGNSKAKHTPEAEVPTDTITTFTMPTIPTTLTTPELRADYLVRHYWENINFADTNYIHHPEITEQAWVDYIDLMRLVPAHTANDALKGLFLQAEKEKKCYHFLIEMADKYLYDPNSPLRNEELYISVLDALIASPILSDTEKILPQSRHELAQKNRVGTQAIDFTYTLASGTQGTLHTLKAPYTLLFINNPGCQACAETIKALKNAPTVNRLIAKKTLKLLSFYPDEELDEWKKHLPEYPSKWINSYDSQQAVQKKGTYDLKAIPTLYLLDKDKTVLLKDAATEEIENYLTESELH